MAVMQAYWRRRFIIAGSILLSWAAAYNEILLSRYNPVSIIISRYPLTSVMVGDVRRAQACFILLGLACIAAAFLSQKIKRFDIAIKQRVTWGIVSALCFLLLLIAIAELTLSPFIHLTEMHVEDERLGWKMTPGATSVWDGVQTTINSKGLRGVELDYAKPDGVARLLYLGDSVIFGYRIEDDRNTIPALTEHSLNAASIRVESINSGVCGYSPWQEYEYLRSEGIKYEPDLVVASIVLNDFTDKLFMTRTDGHFEGFELFLSHTKRNRIWRMSHIALYARFLLTSFDLRHYMVLNRRFTRRPEHNMFSEHWNATFTSIDKISTFCRENNIKLLFVLFPALWQLQNDDTLKPQARIQSHLIERQVPTLDLLPFLRSQLRHQEDIDEHFMDVWHMTPKGNALVAGRIAESVATMLSDEE